ncbi:MAG: TIGR03013 family PEP-CTERM/XrtA system glycosyltransferase [Rhodoferax sp.]|jgi:sugar transferase (PEP-CTERM system associated)|nr:TIGR03013 family PEP-CTERM/XrtA system glycosyltransferase [Rhodoferax sp.]
MIKIFNHYFHKRTLLQICFDLSLLLLALLSLVMSRVGDPALAFPSLLATYFTLAAGLLLLSGALGFYQRGSNRSLVQTAARSLLVWLLMLPLAYSVSRGMQEPMSFGLTLAAMVLVLLMLRVYAIHTKKSAMLRQRVLIFGIGERAKMVGAALTQADPNVDLIGYYAGPNEADAKDTAWGLLSMTNSLTDIVMDQQVDEIVVALTERRGGAMPMRELLDCKVKGVKVVDIATHFERTLGQIRLESVSAGWLIFGDGFGSSWLRSVVKRMFDIVCSALLLVLTLPIMLIAAVLIVLESGFPLFYFQERVGLNGRLFNVVKFRSMRADAEKDGKPRWASAQDDRITRVGKIIRKLRIDELPQLFSVLGGTMSLVGPRPERPFFVDQLTQQIPYYAVRHSVKPGVTGWAQVRYQYGASVEDSAEKLQYDLYYVKNHSLFLDILVLFETVGVVLMGKGAQ